MAADLAPDDGVPAIRLTQLWGPVLQADRAAEADERMADHQASGPNSMSRMACTSVHLRPRRPAKGACLDLAGGEPDVGK
jgi:hypothetical protein